jgi:drug/metabolite transporter superfamily protein YnfA
MNSSTPSKSRGLGITSLISGSLALLTAISALSMPAFGAVYILMIAAVFGIVGLLFGLSSVAKEEPGRLGWIGMGIVLFGVLLVTYPFKDLKDLAGNEVPVSVSGVNYTDREINGYLFYDPKDENVIAGGEGLRPYSGGGIMCCYSLPKNWRPGIKIGLLVDNLKGNGERTRKVIELPAYPDGTPGDLWAIIYPDGTLGAVSTNYGPGHEKWPGKVKGWPVASIEYRRKLWERDVQLERADKAAFERDLRRPDITAVERRRFQEEIENINENIRQLENKKP